MRIPLPQFSAPEHRLRWALQIICVPGRDGERYACESSTSGIGSCWHYGKTLDARYTADRWCNSCIAYFALHGSFPETITIAAGGPAP